ncbi:hypothetical protein PT281_04745 [Lactobacillus sp. ESL0701]|nr:hypothetical protein [Lactobacillus sp. ESL0701]MDF7672572.1 hypothetical protein [Lactobacillus sp. ESL0701]
MAWIIKVFMIALVQKLAVWSFEQLLKLISHFIRNHGSDHK